MSSWLPCCTADVHTRVSNPPLFSEQPRKSIHVRNMIKILLVRICWILHIFWGFKPTLTRYSYLLNMYSGWQCPVFHQGRASPWAERQGQGGEWSHNYPRGKGWWSATPDTHKSMRPDAIHPRRQRSWWKCSSSHFLSFISNLG